MPTTIRRPPTTDQLRHAIDRGHAGDKVNFPDPAAAPLGSDDEAAGMSPSPAERRQAAEQELGDAPPRGSASLWPLWAMIGVGLLVVVAAWLALAAR